MLEYWDYYCGRILIMFHCKVIMDVNTNVQRRNCSITSTLNSRLFFISMPLKKIWSFQDGKIISYLMEGLQVNEPIQQPSVFLLNILHLRTFNCYLFLNFCHPLSTQEILLLVLHSFLVYVIFQLFHLLQYNSMLLKYED